MSTKQGQGTVFNISIDCQCYNYSRIFYRLGPRVKVYNKPSETYLFNILDFSLANLKCILLFFFNRAWEFWRFWKQVRFYIFLNAILTKEIWRISTWTVCTLWVRQYAMTQAVCFILSICDFSCSLQQLFRLYVIIICFLLAVGQCGSEKLTHCSCS